MPSMCRFHKQSTNNQPTPLPAGPPPDYSQATMSKDTLKSSEAGGASMSPQPQPGTQPWQQPTTDSQYTLYDGPPTGPESGWNPPLKQGMTPYTEIPAPQPPAPGQPIMHYYRNHAGHIIQSPLPPYHPAMQCLMQGRHVETRSFGLLGIIMGVCFFPLGCIWTALDFQTRCKRCGEVTGGGCYSC